MCQGFGTGYILPGPFFSAHFRPSRWKIKSFMTFRLLMKDMKRKPGVGTTFKWRKGKECKLALLYPAKLPFKIPRETARKSPEEILCGCQLTFRRWVSHKQETTGIKKNISKSTGSTHVLSRVILSHGKKKPLFSWLAQTVDWRVICKCCIVYKSIRHGPKGWEEKERRIVCRTVLQTVGTRSLS